MTAIFGTVLLMMAVLAAVAVAARRLNIAPSILLVVAGVGVALIPGLAVERLAPELVLLDVRMPGLDGVEVARRLTADHPETLVVLISIEEPIDIPSAATLGQTVPFVRKQDFGPRLLRRVWREHRS